MGGVKFCDHQQRILHESQACAGHPMLIKSALSGQKHDPMSPRLGIEGFDVDGPHGCRGNAAFSPGWTEQRRRFISFGTSRYPRIPLLVSKIMHLARLPPHSRLRDLRGASRQCNPPPPALTSKRRTKRNLDLCCHTLLQHLIPKFMLGPSCVCLQHFDKHLILHLCSYNRVDVVNCRHRCTAGSGDH